jgi:hypothetical protein
MDHHHQLGLERGGDDRHARAALEKAALLIRRDSSGMIAR